MKKLMDKLGAHVSNRKVLYYFLNFTWGIFLTFIGYLLMIILLPFGKIRKYNYILYLEFNRKTGWGFSMGTVFFVGNKANRYTKQHEFGHTVQNAILGPLMIFLVAIPSVIRFWYRRFLFSIKKTPKGHYDDIWFEGNASQIGLDYFLKSNTN